MGGSGQWTVDSGQWTVDSGQWTVDSGQFADTHTAKLFRNRPALVREVEASAV